MWLKVGLRRRLLILYYTTTTTTTTTVNAHTNHYYAWDTSLCLWWYSHTQYHKTSCQPCIVHSTSQSCCMEAARWEFCTL